MASIEQEFRAAFAESRERWERARAAIPGGITHDARHLYPFPLYVDRAVGSKKWDADGHELIDFAIGHGSLLLGHSHPALVEAVQEQIRRGTHYGAGHELEIEWAERVTELIPSAERVEFTSSGTEATLMAMRLARAFTGRDKILKFAGHFHGWHDYAIAGETFPAEGGTPPGVPRAVLDSMVVAPVNDLTFVKQRLAEGDIAAVILEPSGASWASIPLPEGFLAQLRALTQQHQTLLIFDEVITGFRWSPGGKQAKEGVTPDLTTMAKILAGGLPGGAVAGRLDVMELLEFRDDPVWNREKKVGHPGTYNANPLSAAAGSACLQLIADPAVQQHCDALAAKVRAGMNEILVRLDAPGVTWGESSVFHVLLGATASNQTGGDLRIPEGIDPSVLKAATTGQLGAALHQGMLLNGVDLFHSGGMLSLAHTEEDVAKTLAAFETTVRRMQAEGLFA